MPSWTSEELKSYEARRSLSRAKPEQAVRHDALAKTRREEKDSRRITVRITSYRRRLLDPDNLIGGAKYFVDGLRYAALLHGDRQDEIKLEVVQERVFTKSEERTEIELL